MRCLLFFPLAAIFVTIAVCQDLSSDNSPDVSAFQDWPQDLLASQDLPEDLEFFDVDYDLFGGSGALDLLSTNAQDPFSGLEASCLTEDEQSLNKLRRRGETVCSPQAPIPLNEDPLRELGDSFRDLKNFFSIPEKEEIPSFPDFQLPKDPEDRRCLPSFPNHLCCTAPGGRVDTSSIMASMVPGATIYQFFFACSPGTFSIPPFLADFRRVMI